MTMNIFCTAARMAAFLILLISFNTHAAISGPETAQLLNTRYQTTTPTCAVSKPAWHCNGVMVLTQTRAPGQMFWQHDSDATALGAEGLSYLRSDLGIRELSNANGIIIDDLFTAIGDDKELDVLCAYPFTQELAGNRGNNGCALPTTRPPQATDVSSCREEGVIDSETWLAHFQQSGYQPEQQCSLSSIDRVQFAASLSAHTEMGGEWSQKSNRLQVRNWDAAAPENMPVQALFYDVNQTGSLLAAQQDQRDYFNATGVWLPVLRMDLNDSSAKVFGFNLQDQLYEGYSVAARMNARYADTRAECLNQQPAYFCNGVLFRSNDASTAFHAWDPSPGSVKNNGVSFSYARSDIDIDQLVYSRPFGFTFKELQAPAVYSPTLRCAYPYDAGTSGSPDPCTFLGACESLGVISIDLWLARYSATPGRGCAFGPSAAQFELSISVRDNFPARKDWNEIMIAAWPQSIPGELPLEALFFQSGSGGLPHAQFIQHDYYTQTQRFLPLMEMNLAAPDGKMFSYDPANQLAPGAPSSRSQGLSSQD
jgi:hypothetical protein